MPYSIPAVQPRFRVVGAARQRSIATAMLAALAFGVVTVLVERFDAVAVLAVAGLLLAAVTLLLRPELATLLALFLFYINVPAILTQQHGVPAVVAGSLVLLFGIPLVSTLILRRESLRWGPTFGLMLAYLAVLLVSSIGARNPEVALERIQKFAIEGLLFYWLVVNVVRSHETLTRVIQTVLVAGAILGALTTYQEVTGAFSQEFGGLALRNHEILELQQLDKEDPAVRELIQAYTLNQRGNRSGRANGPTDEPNRFAQILVVLLPLAVLAYRTSQSSGGRVGAFVAGMLILSGMVFSDSRGAFATLVAIVLLATYVGWIRPRSLLIGALAGLPLIPVVAPRYVERVASLMGVAAIAEDAGSDEADGAIKGRAAMMFAAAQVFLDHPVIGVGPGQYRAAYSYEYQQRNSRFEYIPKPEGSYAHSLYLELAAEGGVVGLVVFLSIFRVLLRQLVGVRRRWQGSRPELADLATAFALALTAYLGTAVFLHLAIQRYLWLLAALASAALNVARSAERSEIIPGARMPYRSGAGV
jgi:hypothetical protein